MAKMRLKATRSRTSSCCLLSAIWTSKRFLGKRVIRSVDYSFLSWFQLVFDGINQIEHFLVFRDIHHRVAIMHIP